MITLESTEKIALNYFNNGVNPESELVIIPEETVAFKEGYIFSVNTKKYVINGCKGYRVSGIPCILVYKKTGEIFDPYVNEYIYPNDLILQYRRKIRSQTS